MCAQPIHPSGNSPPPPRRPLFSFRAVGALMLREMATSYGRSPGGFLWAILEPVAGIAILTFAFSFFFAAPPIGTSFELFYATAMLPFTLFTTVANRVSGALVFSKPLLSYPVVTFVDAILARFLVNLLAEILVFFIVITGVLLLFETRAVMDIGRIAEALALAAFFALAVGTLNAYLFLRFHAWHVIWSLISRPLFLVSGGLVLFERMPEALQAALWWNPLVHVTGIMRSGFFPDYPDSYTSALYVCGVSMALLLFGLRLLSWHAKWLLLEH
ncbi:ABC transporter permease [Rhodobacter sp. Har01]|uniref:ABC transporter permease n=1 Tax=Rhodobacter sp. Har01 TaxID=2883999 RepID=UPI001D05D7C1|nr:ABC transporter permease [Rhodobacter sp. Har01]MCB6178375.1 ABC transporter permease [Rhodobacter sp. Har01]